MVNPVLFCDQKLMVLKILKVTELCLFVFSSPPIARSSFGNKNSKEVVVAPA